jgi:hypothetical protein
MEAPPLAAARPISDPLWATDRIDRRIIALLAALTVAAVAVYLALGPNFVLDDWWVVAQAKTDGVLGTTDADLAAARPGTVAIYGVTFGLIGAHPALHVVALGVVNLFTAVLLYLLLRRFFPHRLAGAAVFLWILFPTHTSIETWPVTSIIAVSLPLLVLASYLLVAMQPSRWTDALILVLFVCAGLAYEGSIPAAALAILVLPRLAEGRFRPGLVAAGAVLIGLQALWLVTHWHDVKHVTSGFVDMSPVFPAYFGWGIAPDGGIATILQLVALVGIAISVARLVLPSLRDSAGKGEWAVVAGLVIIAVGVAPYTRYFFEPLGAGDRVSYLASVGGALVWSGIAYAFLTKREVFVVAVGVLGLVACIPRWERAQAWDQAGDDAVAIVDAIGERYPDPPERIVIGPKPVVSENITAFLDRSNLTSALLVHYGVRVDAGVSQNLEDWQEVPEDERFDVSGIVGE